MYLFPPSPEVSFTGLRLLFPIIFIDKAVPSQHQNMLDTFVVSKFSVLWLG